jgi:hypothetical protein
MHAPGHCVPAGTQSFAVYVSERLDVRRAGCTMSSGPGREPSR